MAFYFRPANLGFYSDAFHGARTVFVPDPDGTAPADDADTRAPLIEVANPACTLPPIAELIPITADQYAALIDGQSRGQLIALVDGQPALVNPPARSVQEELAAAARERERRLAVATSRIAPLQDAVDLGDATDDESAQLVTWKRYRVALNRLDLSALPIAWPDAPALSDSPTLSNEV